MKSHTPVVEPVPEDTRLSPEFVRRLSKYIGAYDATSVFARRYLDWYADHTGRRSDWFRDSLVWLLERTRPLAGRRVLDFGCGTGSSSVVLAERGATIVGAETEQVSLDIATQRARDLQVADRCAFVRIPYLAEPGDRLPFSDASFDVCTLIGVLEHMRTPERTVCVAEIRRVLKPGGDLFIFDTPNRVFPKDNHTTQLWFVGWLPERLARRYAIWRRRFDSAQDFRRYGAIGLSRREIDRLFPATVWRVTYEKTAKEIAAEFSNLFRPRIAAEPVARVARTALRLLDLVGGRPVYWTASHALGLAKRA